MPNAMRVFATALIAVGAIATSAACGSSTAPSPSASAPPSSSASPSADAGADCLVAAPGGSGIDTAFEESPTRTFKQICPADVARSFGGPEVKAKFGELNAAEISVDGSPVLRVMAGELNSGSGGAFVDTFLSDLSTDAAAANPPKTVASDLRDIGGYPVTYFNISATGDGYTYDDGRTVVIAFNVGGLTAKETEDVFLGVLNGVHS